MQLTAIRIRNFRSVTEEISFSIPERCALIGPNNAGKTNILKALYLFFSSHPATLVTQSFDYDKATDFPFLLDSGRTTIQAFFRSPNPEDDSEMLDLYEDIKQILRIPARQLNAISILLTFSEGGRPTYQVFPSAKRPTASSDLQDYNNVTEEFFYQFFCSFAVHYIQSDKRVSELYESLLMPPVKQAIATKLSSVYETIKEGIGDVNDGINKYLAGVGLSEFAVKLAPPEDIGDLIKTIELNIDDKIESDFSSKGMGIQALTIMSSMLWLKEFYRRNGRSSVWLIEEPESFLHPQLLPAQVKILNQLSDGGTVVYATHALGLVPNDAERIVGVEKTDMRTRICLYETRNKATAALRSVLGVRFGDFFNLSEMVVAVEGRTDRQYLEWFLSYYHSDDHLWPLLRKSEILDYDGISPLQSFIQSNYEYIRRESVFVALFDSDQAGNRAREALQSIFGRKGGYRANEDFVALRWGYSIEGVFSDDLIKMVQTGKGSLFTNYSEDAEGLILPFGIRDGKKMEVFERLTKRAEEEKGFEWAGRFIMLCSALERALEYQCRRLERSAG